MAALSGKTRLRLPNKNVGAKQTKIKMTPMKAALKTLPVPGRSK